MRTEGFCQGFSESFFFLGTVSHKKWGQTNLAWSSAKIWRPENKNPQKNPFCRNCHPKRPCQPELVVHDWAGASWPSEVQVAASRRASTTSHGHRRQKARTWSLLVWTQAEVEGAVEHWRKRDERLQWRCQEDLRVVDLRDWCWTIAEQHLAKLQVHKAVAIQPCALGVECAQPLVRPAKDCWLSSHYCGSPVGPGGKH